MAHDNQILFCESVKRRFPDYFEGTLVLDIGSLDINGNNIYLFHECNYLGVDLMEGKNVDIITQGDKLALPDSTFDTIISTECFEHDRFYEKTLANIVRLLKSGGLFLFTCATIGRPEHGTARTTPHDAPFLQKLPAWSNYYKNLTEADIREVIDIEKTFSIFEFSTNLETKDLYFFGIKKGNFQRRYNYSFSLLSNSRNEHLLSLEAALADSKLDCANLNIRLEELIRQSHAKEINHLEQITQLGRQLEFQLGKQLSIEQDCTGKIDKFQQRLESALTEIAELGKSHAQQLRDNQEAHEKQLQEQIRLQIDREDALLAQLQVQQQKLEVALTQLGERERYFSQQHHHSQRAHEQQINLLQQKIESTLTQLNNREEYHSRQLQEIRQTHEQQISEQSRQNAEREETSKATNLQNARVIAQLSSEICALRSTYTWRLIEFLNCLPSIIFAKKNRYAPDSLIAQETSPRASPPNECAPQYNTDMNNITTSSNAGFAKDTAAQLDDVASSLDQLLSYYDAHFIRVAYYTLLGRAPDPDGMKYYLSRLRKGISKVQILGQLRRSWEGKDRPLPITGLDNVIRRQRLLSIPILGAALRHAGMQSPDGDVQQNIRAIENKFFAQEKDTQQQFAEIFAELNWTISKLKELLPGMGKASPTSGASSKIAVEIQDDARTKQQSATVDNDSSLQTLKKHSDRPHKQYWGILATPHTLFLANLIAKQLVEHGWEADVLNDAPANFPHDMYVVICPQMFKLLPPGEKRIIYQVEQSVSSRWFTDSYFNILENSLAVLDYALVNIEFLAKHHIAYPLVHYLPIGADRSYSERVGVAQPCCDVLFYGDANSSSRRRAMLDVLKLHFNVRECSEVFGEDIKRAITNARLVINLHYYENALLEMPRIQECISLGTPVVSESAQDQYDYPEIKDSVHFFDEGNTEKMLKAVRDVLSSPTTKEQLTRSARDSHERFKFMFDRFLIAENLLPVSHASTLNLPISNYKLPIVLSLPETISRRRTFEQSCSVESTKFDGLRLKPGWVGCGLSYSTLARNAIGKGVTRLTVMEDDVVLPEDFDSRIRVIHKYLDKQQGGWDVFSGVIAVLHPEVAILNLEDYEGMRFVTIDKMLSTVFNIYSSRALHLLSAWNPSNRDDQTNTIDKYLERQGSLRVVVTMPFFVGHREDARSTIWGFMNSQYNDLIAASETSLKSKMWNYMLQKGNAKAALG